ncbi:MAG: hypothetical protein H0T74_06430 [Rubrobacteraceae bacterium]|nr:hypothetical protein [Rubrobacteraceae bacterium]
MKKMVAIIMIVGSVLVAGCSEEKASSGGQDNVEQQSEIPRKAQVNNQKPKTVIVNEGMSNNEEDKLNERIAD